MKITDEIRALDARLNAFLRKEHPVEIAARMPENQLRMIEKRYFPPSLPGGWMSGDFATLYFLSRLQEAEVFCRDEIPIFIPEPQRTELIEMQDEIRTLIAKYQPIRPLGD